jgi:hypothetical protein
MHTAARIVETVGAAGGVSVVAQSALRYIAFMRAEINLLPDCPLRAAYREQLTAMEELYPVGPRTLE